MIFANVIETFAYPINDIEVPFAAIAVCVFSLKMMTFNFISVFSLINVIELPVSRRAVVIFS